MKTTVTCLAFALASFSPAVLTAADVPRELTLPNLASAIPWDPLPPLRANHPSAAEMAQVKQAHPYLFFTAESRETLRQRRNQEPFTTLEKRIRKRADEYVLREAPPQATMRKLPMYLPDGSYNPEYAEEEYANQFFKQSYLMREVIPTLGFAYQLTGERAYAEAGKRWLLAYARREKFTPPGREADFHIAQVMFALSLGYDWLHEALDEKERDEVRSRLVQLSGPMHEAGKEILNQPVRSLSRKSLGGNHFRRTHGMFSLTPLVLLYEVTEAQQWLDVELQVQRDRLYPSGYAPDGAYQDAWDHYRSSLDDPMPFAAALHHMGGENLFDDPNLGPRFRGMPFHFLYGLEGRWLDRPWNAQNWSGQNEPSEIFSWLVLASQLRDPVAQWIAMRDNGLARIDEVFAYLFYDPTVPAVPPVDPHGSVYFPYSGLVKLAEGWGRNDFLLSFRCGTRLAVDKGDQNGIRVRAGGKWLAPNAPDVGRLPAQSDLINYDLMGWFWGSPGQNVIVANPAGMSTLQTYQETGALPIAGGVQWSTYTEFRNNIGGAKNTQKRQPVYRAKEEWLTDPSVPKSGELRVVQFGGDLDYVLGDNRRAFFFRQPEFSERHVLLVKGGKGKGMAYVLICDEIGFGDGEPETFGWQLHVDAPVKGAGDRVDIQGPAADLQVRWLLPADGQLIRLKTPAPIEAERTDYVQYRTRAPAKTAVYLTALLPREHQAGKPLPEMKLVPAEGGWAVEVRTEEGVDLILFRAHKSTAVGAGSVRSQGTAALLRQPKDGEPVLYSLGI